MTKTEAALKRLDAALSKLEVAFVKATVAREEGEPGQELPLGGAESDRLEAEIRTLRQQAKEDAKLRAEAAGAVRDALRDLRTVVSIHEGRESPANA